MSTNNEKGRFDAFDDVFDAVPNNISLSTTSKTDNNTIHKYTTHVTTNSVNTPRSPTSPIIGNFDVEDCTNVNMVETSISRTDQSDNDQSRSAHSNSKSNHYDSNNNTNNNNNDNDTTNMNNIGIESKKSKQDVKRSASRKQHKNYKEYKNKKNQQKRNKQKKKEKRRRINSESDTMTIGIAFNNICNRAFCINKFNFLRILALIVTFVLMSICMLYSIASLYRLELTNFQCKAIDWEDVVEHSKEINNPSGEGNCYRSNRRYVDHDLLFSPAGSAKNPYSARVSITAFGVVKCMLFGIPGLFLAYLFIRYFIVVVMDTKKTMLGEWYVLGFFVWFFLFCFLFVYLFICEYCPRAWG